MDAEEKCAGCGKAPRNKGLRSPTGLVAVDVAPGRKARVCVAARSTYADEPIPGCRDAALAKARFCRGCGCPEPEDHWKTGAFDSRVELCDDCTVLLDRGRTAQAAEPKEWYAISPTRLVTYWSSERDFEEFCGGIARGLAALCAGVRTAPPAGAHVVATFPDERDNSYGQEKAYAELTATQAEGLRGFVTDLRKALGHAWAQGSRSGRSLLHALASGELTTGELDDRMVKAAERERDAGEGRR